MDKGAIGAGMNAILTGIGVKSGEDTGITSADLKASAAMNTSLLGGIPGLDLIDRGARIKAMEAGIAQNPFTHVTYEGHQLRSFNMDFKMISESSAEAKTIAEIIDVIRNYFVSILFNHFRRKHNIWCTCIEKSSVCSIINIKFLFFS